MPNRSSHQQGSLWVVNSPPKQGEIRFKIDSPDPGIKVHGFIVSRRPVGVMIHFGVSSFACTNDVRTCSGCKDGWIPTFVGFIGYARSDGQRIAMARLPKGCWLDTPEFHDGGPDLYGWEITVKRRGPTKHTPVIVELRNLPAMGMRPTIELPKPVDILPSIYATFGRQDVGMNGKIKRRWKKGGA